MAEAGEPVIDLDLENRGHFRFWTDEEAIEWVTRERAFWAWSSGPGVSGGLEGTLSKPLGNLRDALRMLAGAQNHRDANPDQATQDRAAAVRIMRSVFHEQRFPLSNSSVAQFIAGVARRSRSSGIFAFAYIVGAPDIQPRTADDFRGLSQAMAFENANDGALGAVIESQLAAGDSLNQSLQEKIGLYDVTMREGESKFAGLVATYTKLILEGKGDLINLDREWREGHGSALQKATTAFEGLKRAYEQQLGVRAPVLYWKKKRWAHIYSAIASGVLAVIAFGLLGYFANLELKAILGTATTANPPQYWQLGTLVLIAFLWLWILRILTRIFLSQLHMIGDASERMTMIQTYLALQKGERATKVDELKLVLEALFRRASDGIVREDGMPLSIFELLTRPGNK